MATLQFVDHGSSARVPFSMLRKYKMILLKSLGQSGRIRALAVQTELAGIKPQPFSGREGDFSLQVFEDFTRLVGDASYRVFMKVGSRQIS